MDTSNNGIVRRRRRTHSAQFKAKVVSACRQPGVSIAAVALANGLNANLLRRWVVTEEQTPPGTPTETAHAAPLPLPSVENRTFIPVQLERSTAATSQEITIELRRGATVVKVDWPLAVVSANRIAPRTEGDTRSLSCSADTSAGMSSYCAACRCRSAFERFGGLSFTEASRSRMALSGTTFLAFASSKMARKRCFTRLPVSGVALMIGSSASAS
jgi:transposase